MPGLRLRNQRTQALMQRDVTWQIVAPLAVAAVIVVALMVLLILPVGAPARSVWADISLIFLIIPAAVIGLIVLAILVALAVGLAYALRELPYVFKQAQDWVALAGYRVNGGTSQLADVILTIRSTWTGVRKAAEDVRAMLRVRRAG